MAEEFMQLALEAALKGHRGANPLVGAVLLAANGEVLATGYHRGAGSPHAEAEALSAVSENHPDAELATATLYVTLEPCTHQGRQPACTTAILTAGVGRVVYGAADPTEAASGGGNVLRDAGVEVIGGLLEDQCQRLNHRWNLAKAQRRPFVTAHLAQTLDGRIAAADGSSQWITSAASRAHSHQVRGRADAILAGTSTVLTDDPRLTSRSPTGELLARQPLRCVMGLRDIPSGSALTAGRPEGEGWMHLRTRDPRAALERLSGAEHEGHRISHVMLEGGARILSAFFAEDLVDEIYCYQAPMLLGAGPTVLEDIGVTTLSQARSLSLDPAGDGAVQQLDTDLCLHLSPKEH